MTDITKYKNVSLSLEAYNQLKKQSRQVCDINLSISKTVEIASNLLQGVIDDPRYVLPISKTPAYVEMRNELMQRNQYGISKRSKH